MSAPYGLAFDADTHTYRHADQVVVSATQALERVGLVDFRDIPADTRRKALARGTRVHRAAQLLVKRILDWSSVDERERGYVEAAGLFLTDAAFLVDDAEVLVWNPAHRYAGTTDIIGTWQGEYAVGDYCTGDLWEACKDLQTAGYAEALRHNPPPAWIELGPDTLISRVGIRLHRDGTYQAEPYRDTRDFRIFAAAVSVANEQIRRGRRGVHA